MIIVRKSIEDDKREIYHLLNTCFYDVDDEDVNEHVEGELSICGRFLLALNEESEIIGLLGIIPPTYSRYDGYFLDWGCVLPEYRGQHVISILLDEFMAHRVHGVRVWAECWRTSRNKDGHAHIHNILTRQGFRLVVPKMLKWPVSGVCWRVESNCCKRVHDGRNCCCWEDLYCYED